ncbi:Ubiquitin-like-specific protease 1A [Capsicum chinense]|nr:Ubiquitin-like-specific protease 1A [Capsicum chinense]
MDFHSLAVTRRELQAVCKKNKIPANMTNVAMADALQSRQFVDGIEEVLKTCESDVANSSMESPGKSEAISRLISGRGGYNYQSVRRWTSKRKLVYCLLECDKIFVPIHKQVHWCLAVISKKDEKFQYLDLLGARDIHVLKVLVIRDYVDSMDELLQPLVDEAMPSGYSCTEEWISAMVTSLWTYLAKRNISHENENAVHLAKLIYREGNPHSSNMVFGLGPSMKRADLSLQIRPRHAGFGSSRKYSLHSPGPTGGFLRALSFIKKAASSDAERSSLLSSYHKKDGCSSDYNSYLDAKGMPTYSFEQCFCSWNGWIITAPDG